MVVWSAERSMGVADGFGSRSSERSIRPGLALGELGLLPNSRVDDRCWSLIVFPVILLPNDAVVIVRLWNGLAMEIRLVVGHHLW
jgi:hypothetical protein